MGSTASIIFGLAIITVIFIADLWVTRFFNRLINYLTLARTKIPGAPDREGIAEPALERS